MSELPSYFQLVGPYKTIDAFFNGWSLHSARSILAKAFLKADEEKYWKHSSPANLLWFFEMFNDLVEAAFELTERPGPYEDDAAKLKPDKNTWYVTDYASYCGWHINNTPWHFFPRHLSKKEFLDPFLVLKKVARYHPLKIWKEKLKDVMEHALSWGSLFEFDDGKGLLACYIYMQKLLEAAHLINVRVIKQDENGPRPKWKNKRT